MPRRNVLSAPRRRAALVALALATAAGALVGTSADAVAAASQPIVVNFATAPATLDPAEACGLTDLTVIDNVYSRLTKYGSKAGPDGTTQVDPSHIVPYVAKSWKITNGGKKYTFTLRSGLKFPSGKPLDAAASIVDKSVVDAHGGVQKGKVNTWMSGHVAGLGPFTLKSYAANQKAVLASNPAFFAPGKAPTVTANFIASDPTLLLQAKSGAADVTIGLSKQSTHSLIGDSKVKIIANDTSIAEWLGMVNTVAPFDNVKFREAMTYAVPYQDILDKIAYGYGTLFYGPIEVAMPEFNKTLEAPRAYDLTKAKALLAASGVATPVAVGLDIQAGNPTDEQIATIIQGSWAQLGVTVTINKLSPTDYINKLETHKSQSFLRYDGPGVIEAGYMLGYDMKCKVSFNLASICIPAADKVLAKARQTPAGPARTALWNQLIKLWNAQSPKIPVYGDQATAVVSTSMKSYYYSHEIDFSNWSK